MTLCEEMSFCTLVQLFSQRHIVVLYRFSDRISRIVWFAGHVFSYAICSKNRV